MGEFSLPHILIVLVIVLVFFGPSRLPGLGKSLGEAIRGFKSGIGGDDNNNANNQNPPPPQPVQQTALHASPTQIVQPQAVLNEPTTTTTTTISQTEAEKSRRS